MNMAGQTPFSQIFPPPPKSYQSPWYYASLQSFWLYYLVDPGVLRSRLATLPAADELEVALFDVGGKQTALASLDLQRYTGQGPTYLESTSEVEFNIYVYPKVREPDVPQITLDHYLRGYEQTKTIGGYRLHVPCDDIDAVNAGIGLYGEPKFLAYFEYDVPSVNGPPYPPKTVWSYHVYQDKGNVSPPVKGDLIFGVECDLVGAPSAPGNCSPLIEYGAVEDDTGTMRLIANFWDFYGPFDTYRTAALDPPWRAQLTFGTKADPKGVIADLKLLLGSSQPVAAQVFTSSPVSAESRGFFPTPT
jgi:hypothetical protein